MPSGKPAILVEKIAIAEQGSLLMSAGGTRFNPPFAYHSTMIITSGSLAGQGAAITLTVIYGTLRSRVRGAGNIPEPANSAAIPHFISNGMFECHPGSEWVDLKAVKKRTQNPLLVERLAGDAASPGKSCFKLVERIRRARSGKAGINGHIKRPRLAIRQASPQAVQSVIE